MTAEIERSDAAGVAVLRFCRPDVGNAFTDAQVTALATALDDIAADDTIRVLVLTGAGRHFNVGGLAAPPDRTPADWERSPDAHRLQVDAAVRVARQLHRIPKLTIAAVNGGCAGAGMALALAADLRFASARARFNTAFLDHGLPGELGAIWFATRLLGLARARELFLMPRKIDAPEAHRIGLVTDVLDADDFLLRVAAIAERIAASNPEALRAMKANFNDALSTGLDDYLDRETDRLITAAWTVPAATRRRLGGRSRDTGKPSTDTPTNRELR